MRRRRFRGQLKGAVTTSEGNLRVWTGLPVGAGVPLIAAQAAKGYFSSWIASGVEMNTELFTRELHFANMAVLASPFLLALPLLIFKKTRGAALGIIGGGIVGDLIYSYYPGAKASTSSSTTQTTQTEGAPVQILGR